MNWLIILSLALAFFRVFLSFKIPFLDNTEARYSLVIKLMDQTKDYLTPYMDLSFPFFAKPPLSFWLGSLTYAHLGGSEFSLRLTSLALSFSLILIIYFLMKNKKIHFPVFLFSLLSLPQFFVLSALQSTDMSLVFCTSLSLIFFYLGFENKKYFYLFFIFLALSLLAKGLIGPVLILAPCLIWTFYFKKQKEFLKKAPIFLGLFLVLSISLPWYILMEKKHPGFLNYFILGEHFERFLIPSWSGDLYGQAPEKMMGSIWLYLVSLSSPWIIIFFFKWKKNFSSYLKDPWLMFLSICIIFPPLFFTFSRNIMPSYNAPLSLFLALFIASQIRLKEKSFFYSIFSFYLILFSSFLIFEKKILKLLPTDKYLIQSYEKKELSPLYSYKKRTYSSQFYSSRFIPVLNKDELQKKIKEKKAFSLIVLQKNMSEIKEVLKDFKKINESSQSYLFSLKI